MEEALQPWKNSLAVGLSTFLETEDPTRSDCHAWSAGPNYHFLATVAGIRSTSPGFQSISIRPQPGNFLRFEAEMPHTNGMIELRFYWNKKEGYFWVTLPEGITGTLFWDGKMHTLKPGMQEIGK